MSLRSKGSLNAPMTIFCSIYSLIVFRAMKYGLLRITGKLKDSYAFYYIFLFGLDDDA